MGLFSRQKPDAAAGPRSAAGSEAQTLRVKARRRLIGALALVLTAVIIVPMLLDPESVPPAEQPLVIPPIPEPATPEPSVAAGGSSGVVSDTPLSVDPPPAGLLPDTPSAPADNDRPVAATPISPAPGPAAPAAQPPAAAPASPAAKPAPPGNRTDDGSVALALLEGRRPSGGNAAPAAASGSFVLQIAAYSTEKDAQSRRDNLVSSGLTNAYVERANAGGKQTYRLRVGPFPTREAAQAAQARLRALGYENGFISAK